MATANVNLPQRSKSLHPCYPIPETREKVIYCCCPACGVTTITTSITMLVSKAMLLKWMCIGFASATAVSTIVCMLLNCCLKRFENQEETRLHVYLIDTTITPT